MKVIKTNYANVKFLQGGIHYTDEQKDRIRSEITLICNNSYYAKTKDGIGLRTELHSMMDMLNKNGEITDKQVENCDYNIVLKK